MTNYYEILEVEDFSSLETIRHAHRKLALKYHPDRNRGDKACEEKFKIIQDAYDHLNTHQRKQVYDEQLTAFYAYKEAEPSYESYSYPRPQAQQRYNPRTTHGFRFSWTIAVAVFFIYRMISNNLSQPDYNYSNIIYQNGSYDQNVTSLLETDSGHSDPTVDSEMISRDGHVLFTIGSSKQQVIGAQGRPFHIEVVDIFNKEVWSYNRSTISFEGGYVTGYNNADSNLNVTLKGASASPNKSSYSRGSSTSDVLAIQGIPGSVTRIQGTSEEIWTYGTGSLTIKNNVVEDYTDNSHVLHVK